MNLLSVIITLLIIYYCYKQWMWYNTSISVLSSIDNKYYRVRNTKNKQQNADTLATVNQRISVLIGHLKGTNNNNTNVKLLVSRYNPDSLIENISLENTTYTVNKGSEIAVCLTSRDSDDLVYDINRIMFVIIHELAHVGCKTYGHNTEFKIFFIFLLKKAVEVGIYKYEDYSQQPVEYCGMTINASPISNLFK